MAPTASRAELVTRSLAAVAIAVSIAGAAVHASVGFRGAYLSHVSGVWLTLARDVAEYGVLYRDLASDLGYGGTRYFPLFFLLISGFLKTGTSLLTAGILVGVIALLVLGAAAFRIARASGLTRLAAGVAVGAATTPYFVLQAVFEARADVLATGLNLLGVSLLLPLWRQSRPSDSGQLIKASTAFTLAFATKLTAITLPAAAVVVLAVTGAPRRAVRLAGTVCAMCGGFLAIVVVASGGRAWRVWWTCLFGGTDAGGTVSGVASGAFLPGLVSSHLVVVAGSLALAALVAGAVLRKSVTAAFPFAFPLALWIAAGLTLGMTLSSPGTVPANHVVEWLVLSILLPVMVLQGRAQWARLATVTMAALCVWMALQNSSRARAMRSTVSAESELSRQEFIQDLRSMKAPILSESALWPLMAGREVVVGDAFAARIVMASHPEIEQLFVDEIARRKYTAIVLEFDPSSQQGRGVYAFSHLGATAIRAIETHYRFDRAALPNALVFVPRSAAQLVDTPRRY